MRLQAPSSHSPLRGIKVVEWGDFIAAPYAARLLSDAGAEVVKVEPLEGDCARREGPFLDNRPGPQRSGLFAYVNRGKRSVRLDPTTLSGRNRLLQLAETADVFIHDQPALSDSALRCAAADLLSTNPGIIVVSVTPFGVRGPRARHKADDLVVVSASGLAAMTPGLPDEITDPEAEPPLRPSNYISEFVGGLHGAIGAMAALLARHRTGRGGIVEVSKQEGLACLLNFELGIYSYGGIISGRIPYRTDRSPNHYLPIADGWAAIVAFMDAHWSALLGLMGNPAWAGDPRFADWLSRSEHWQDLKPLLMTWLREQTSKRLLRQTQDLGIPCAPALTIGDAIENEHVAGRQFLVPSRLPGDERGRLPGDVFVIDGQRRTTKMTVPRLGQDTELVLLEWIGERGNRPTETPAATEARPLAPLPLTGMRVIDLGQFIAMPTAGQTLAFLGAEVIAIESQLRIVSRRTGPFAGERSPNTSSNFNHHNRGKRSCTLNLRTSEGLGLAKRLVATADVVLENFSPGTMQKLGLGYEQLRVIKPDLIMVSLSACGSSGPWRHYSALHSGVILLSGLAAVTGYEGGHPRLVGSVIPDPVAAAYCVLAVLQALHHRHQTGQGQYIEVSMLEILQGLIPQAVLEYTMLGREPRRVGNRHPWKAPHGVYRSLGEDRWLAISVANETEWQALCHVMGRAKLADDPRFASMEKRRSAVTALDEIITAWSRAVAPEEAAERLQRAGVAASLVYNSRDVLLDPHMRERGFIHEDVHPLAGSHPMTTLPYHFAGMAPMANGHAPLLGADNQYVFGQILGLSATEIRELEEAKVIY